MKIWNNFRSVVRRARHDNQGVTAIEYAMIASLIAVAIFLSVSDVGTALANGFTAISDDLTGTAG